MEKKMVLWGRTPCYVRVNENGGFEIDVTVKCWSQTEDMRPDGPTHEELESLFSVLAQAGWANEKGIEWSDDYEIVEVDPVQ